MKTTAPNQVPDDMKEKITETNVTEMGVIGAGTQDVYGEEDSGVDPIYQAKAKILNDAFQEMGMGRYQVSPPLAKAIHPGIHLCVH